MRILFVEGDTHLAESLTEILTTHRYAVDLVKDGESAWEQIKIFVYDLVLLDVTLPKLDGIHVCRRLAVDEQVEKLAVPAQRKYPVLNSSTDGSNLSDPYIIQFLEA